MTTNSRNRTPRQLGLDQLKHDHELFIKQTVIKYKFNTYLKMIGVELEAHLDEYENNFTRLNYYKSKSKFYNNNGKIK